jgi:hypothetical protein
MFAEYSAVHLIIILSSWKLNCIATSPWSAIGLNNIQIEETIKKKEKVKCFIVLPTLKQCSLMWNELPPWNYVLLFIINLKLFVFVFVYFYIFILILLLTANGFIPGGSVLQCKIGQYNTIQYNTITHITHNNIQHSRHSRSKITTKTKKKTHYTILRLRNE